MKIDMSQTLKGAKKEEIKSPEGEVLLLRDICCSALLSPIGDEKVTPDQKRLRYKLWKKIDTDEEAVELTSKEITLLNDCIGLNYTTIIVGQTFDMLEGCSE